MIRVERLCKFYGEQAAIADVSFTIARGEIIGLLGLNGAGKSTILKILSSLIVPTSGEVLIDGISLEDNPQKIRGLIGFLPDTPPLYQEMEVAKYLQFVAQLKGVAAKDVDAAVESAMDKTALQSVAETLIGNLSHGYRQRVGIAQAIVHSPPVLILDEPINGLDPIQIVEMRDLILSLRNDHTVILSSHILSEITKTCDRILIVDKGRLVAEGSGATLREQMPVHVEVVVRHLSDETESRLQSLVHTKVVGISRVGAERVCIDLELAADVRSQVAQLLVTANCELLSMTRQGDELEALFMKFVRSA